MDDNELSLCLSPFAFAYYMKIIIIISSILALWINFGAENIIFLEEENFVPF